MVPPASPAQNLNDNTAAAADDDDDDGAMDEYMQATMALAEKFEEDGDDVFAFEDPGHGEGDDLIPDVDDEPASDPTTGAHQQEHVNPDIPREPGPEDEDLSAPPTDSSAKLYPVVYSAAQRLACLDLHNKLQAKDSSETDLLRSFHNATLSLFTSQVEQAEHFRWHIPIESFIISFNLREDGSFRRPEAIASNLSILQYWAQFAVVFEGVHVQKSLDMFVPHLSVSNSSLHFTSTELYRSTAGG